jgi:hypothetical protein
VHSGGLAVSVRPTDTLSDVEYITVDYGTWYNRQRLMHRLGRAPTRLS